MEGVNFQDVIEQIPIRFNLISMVMLGGVMQGFMLSLVIAIRSTKTHQPLRIMGWFLFFISLIGMDTYFCYTGLMKHTLWANDSTEVFILLLGPTIYFFLRSLLNKDLIDFKVQWIHFVLPASYLVLHSIYLSQPLPVKLNCYTGAYFPHLPYVEEPDRSRLTTFSFFLRDYWRLTMMFSLVVYTLFSLRIVIKQREKFKKEVWWKNYSDKYGFSKNFLLFFLVGFLIVAFVFWNYDNDLGDHYISIFYSIVIYGISIIMLSESRFFEKSWISDKYDTSGFKNSSNLMIDRVIEFVKQDNYYLKHNGSLKDLAQQLNTTPNYLSQVINTQTGGSFSDFINQYRVQEAKKRLIDDSYAHLTIAGVGQTVGFKSKSAFYAAFKKHALITPSAYLKNEKKKEAS